MAVFKATRGDGSVHRCGLDDAFVSSIGGLFRLQLEGRWSSGHLLALSARLPIVEI